MKKKLKEKNSNLKLENMFLFGILVGVAAGVIGTILLRKKVIITK